MRLLRVGPPGEERPAVLATDTTFVDVSDVVVDYDADFFESGGPALLRGVVEERALGRQVEQLEGWRVGSPVARPHQILCIGLNYRDHAAETGQAVPDEPIVFTKSPNTLVGPTDDVLIPPGSTKTDWEVELAIVIGTRCSYLPDRAAAQAVIAGYAVCNDVSERAHQLERGGQWCKGKSAATFNPMGPWLVTPDDVTDPTALGLWLDVNGQRRQTGSTSTMIFDPAKVVHYLSQFFVLEPGDIVNTGTPPGVGMGMDPQVFLAPGDVVELGIDGLGAQRQTFRSQDGVAARG